MPRRTPAQKQASLNNNCLRTFAALERALVLAGHHDFEHLLKELENQFRKKLTKKGQLK